MPSPAALVSILRAFRPSSAALFVATGALLVASPALADECVNDGDCGFGFACETVVTSSSSGTGGIGGMAGGMAGIGGSAPAGGSGGTGSGIPAGSAGVGAAPPPPAVCGNGLCETWGESPMTCADDCVYTTICAAATCTADSECASGYVCPAPGSGVGTGGGPNVTFCGDLICSSGETAIGCPVDCDPNYRRCTPGNRGCVTNADCAAGFVCGYYMGTGGVGGAQGDAPGGTAGIGSGGTSGSGGAPAGGGSNAAPAGGTVGTAGYAGGGGAGVGGAAGTGTGVGGGMIPNGGTDGGMVIGMCMPSSGGTSYGGTSGVGGDYGGTLSGGASTTGGTRSGGTGPGGTDAGGTAGNGGNGGNGDRVVVTHGGCSMANGGASSTFAAFLVGALALLRVGRRRAR